MQGGNWKNPVYRLELRELLPQDAKAEYITRELTMSNSDTILLIVARCSKLAQMTSWWVGVLYTVLILRWIMYNGILI